MSDDDVMKDPEIEDTLDEDELGPDEDELEEEEDDLGLVEEEVL